MRRAWFVAGLCVLALSAQAGPAPDATTILFEAPQLADVPAGTVLSYRYHRRSDMPDAPFGPLMDDHIRLTIEPGDAPQSRTVRVAMFSGEQRRAAGPFENVTANPVLILTLEHGLRDLARIVGANPRYIKNAIRAALRDKAAVTPAEVTIGGRTVPAWRIAIQPLSGDANAGRLRGFDSLAYTFLTSPAVPGTIVSIEAAAQANRQTLIEESLSYEPAAE